MKNFIIATLSIVFISLSCNKPETLSKEEVIAVINRFDAGWKTKNRSEVDSVLSQSYIYFTQSGGTFSRENVVVTAASSDYVLENLERRQISYKIEGNTAVINTIWKGKGTYRGLAFDDLQRCSMIVIKKDGIVQILSEHCTLIK
jgi:hypothetical protein